jgi:hypothetical protein
MQCSPAALTVTLPDCMTKPAFLAPPLRQKVRSISSSHPKVGNVFFFRGRRYVTSQWRKHESRGWTRRLVTAMELKTFCFQGTRDRVERSFCTSRRSISQGISDKGFE